MALALSVSPTQAFSQAYSFQRKVAEDGETNEEVLLQESATKEAYYMGRLLEQQDELKTTRSQASNTQAENERLGAILQELREVGPPSTDPADQHRGTASSIKPFGPAVVDLGSQIYQPASCKL